jgi:hypothetical protein
VLVVAAWAVDAATRTGCVGLVNVAAGGDPDRERLQEVQQTVLAPEQSSRLLLRDKKSTSSEYGVKRHGELDLSLTLWKKVHYRRAFRVITDAQLHVCNKV